MDPSNPVIEIISHQHVSTQCDGDTTRTAKLGLVHLTISISPTAIASSKVTPSQGVHLILSILARYHHSNLMVLAVTDNHSTVCINSKGMWGGELGGGGWAVDTPLLTRHSSHSGYHPIHYQSNTVIKRVSAKDGGSLMGATILDESKSSQ